MVKEIIKDEFFLKQKSKSCTKEDLYIANELLETIQAYKEQCVGMAANMIGYLKTMMVVLDENKYLILINPVILKTKLKRLKGIQLKSFNMNLIILKEKSYKKISNMKWTEKVGQLRRFTFYYG